MNALIKPLCALLIVVAALPGPTSAATRPRPRRNASPAAACCRSSKTEADRRPVWRVKVLTAKGEVRVILIDAASGRVIG